jgi:hypothetical protein
MRTIRGRFAASYAVALAATMFVFALVIYLVQRRENLGELDQRARLESDLIAATMGEAYRARGSRDAGLVVPDPKTGQPVLAPDVTPFLEGIPGYVVVIGPDGDVLHLSPEARALPYGSLSLLLGRAFARDTASGFGTLDLGGSIGHYVRPITDAG